MKLGLHPLKLDKTGVLVRLFVFRWVYLCSTREIDGSKRAVAAGEASLAYVGDRA